MGVNFLNQNPCIPSWLGFFQFDIFFIHFLSSSVCISALGPFLSSSSSLVTMFIHSAFSLCFFGCHIFVQNCYFFFFFWRLVVGMFWCHALPVIYGIFFHCFGMFYFVSNVLPFVDISLISLLSPELSSLFPQVVLSFFLVLSFPFSSHIFQEILVLPFWSVFVDVLSTFPAKFPILGLTVSSCFLRGSQFYHTLICPMHRLVHLPLSYYSLICKAVFDLLFPFLF